MRSPHAARACFHSSSLLDQPSPLSDRIVFSSLPSSPSLGMDVCAAKLQKGSQPTRAYEPHAAIDGPPARPTPRHPPLDKDEDLLIQMNKAYLLALNPTNSGWYAELAICEEDAMAMREFFEAVRNHASHEQPALAFVPQMFDPSYEEAACGIAAKLMAKVRPHMPAA